MEEKEEELQNKGRQYIGQNKQKTLETGMIEDTLEVTN